ncbi:hypothetical protein ACC698_38065, partial [Rhizobium johnstonii]
GFGTGLTAMVLAATVSSRCFTKHRGLFVGMLSASSATGQLVFLPLMAELTERYGEEDDLAHAEIIHEGGGERTHEAEKDQADRKG